MSASNKLTADILNFCFKHGILAWRNNTVGIPMAGGGLRTASKKGVSDIIAVVPPYGHFLGIEVKVGEDKLSLEQKGFITNVKKMGGTAIVVSSMADFKTQFFALLLGFEKLEIPEKGKK